MAAAAVPTLPLRADVLLSNSLFEELDNGISAEFLRHYLETERVEEAEFLELQVDAVGASQRVENIGELLPNLRQLRLNQSCICTLRDLGTNLSQLRVLWLCRSSLQDLGGIAALPVLEELYVSFNDVRELSPLCTHEALQVLDLEGNLIDEFDEVRALQAVSTLRELNLSLNPFWKSEGLSREQVLKSLPQIEVLDDAPRDITSVKGVEDSLLDGHDTLDMGIDVAALLAAEQDPHTDSWQSRTEDSKAVRDLMQRAGAGYQSSQQSSNSCELDEGLVIEGSKRKAWSFARLAHEASSPAVAGDASTANSEGANCRLSRAVAEFHAGRERLRASLSARGGCRDLQARCSEPSECDLLVERLKQAERPTPSLWQYQTMSARPAARRPPTAFFPGRRPLTAWSSGRPTTASSGTGAASSRSGAPAESEASTLTAGDDGMPLAGNPLAAVRRRRRVAAAQGEDEFSIRGLLRRTEAEAASHSQGAAGPPPLWRGGGPGGGDGPRCGTPDVRIGPARLLTAAPRSTACRSPASASGVADMTGCGETLAPSLTTSAGEVLFLE